jgi:hypothetical protein
MFQANCSPVMCTWVASWGMFSLICVQMRRDSSASITQISAGTMVQMTSSRLFPCV